MLPTWLDWMKRRSRATTKTANPPEPDAPISAPSMASALAVAPWFVDHLNVSGDSLFASGWSIPINLSKEPPNGWFTVNGQTFDELRYPFPRPDVGAVFWMHPGAELSGFEGKIEHLSQLYPDGALEVQRLGLDTPAIERGRNSLFKPNPARHTDLPDADRRFRVIADRDPNGFLVSGATDYHRIDRAVIELSGKHLHEFDRVLDWGVGCGRIARHFPRASAGGLTGCDIDHDNVEWCSSHLAGTFVQSSMQPPLPFGNESFDVIYGVSIFTHLRESMQLRWLEELDRVLAPGGIILVTIHGQTAIDFSRSPPAEYWRLREEVARQGILVTSSNPQLDGHADHGGDYVNVLQSIDYVRRVWGRYFRVEHVLEGYILHHDLVILRKA
jgi:SAM-dependent methyltransferase